MILQICRVLHVVVLWKLNFGAELVSRNFQKDKDKIVFVVEDQGRFSHLTESEFSLYFAEFSLITPYIASTLVLNSVFPKYCMFL